MVVGTAEHKHVIGGCNKLPPPDHPEKSILISNYRYLVSCNHCFVRIYISISIGR